MGVGVGVGVLLLQPAATPSASCTAAVVEVVLHVLFWEVEARVSTRACEMLAACLHSFGWALPRLACHRVPSSTEWAWSIPLVCTIPVGWGVTTGMYTNAVYSVQCAVSCYRKKFLLLLYVILGVHSTTVAVTG